MAFLKPQSPMTKGSDYFYPLTTSDQVIMDGGYRLNEIVGKTKKSTIILYANGWSAEAPYCYSIAIKGLSDKVNMKMLPHFPEDFEDKQLMKEEIAKISFASRENNILTFECWDEIPAIDLLIDIEIDAMYPIKGASIEMNYSVVGGIEQPTKPTKNMIWVNTDQNITNWVFSKSEPKSLEEGMIWFTTGNDSAVSFFTLTMDGKEFDEVYPICAKQYVGGTWVDKTAKSWQGGEWVEWIIYIFKSGHGNIQPVVTSSESNGRITVSNDEIIFDYTATSGNLSYYSTKEPIDVTNLKTLCGKFLVTAGADQSAFVAFGANENLITDGTTSASYRAIAKIYVDSNVQDIMIDISSLTGLYYIGFHTSLRGKAYEIYLK